MKKVTVGSRLSIPASTYNSFIDAAQFVKDSKGGGAISNKKNNSGLIIIKNNSGSNLSAYNILGIDEPITTPTTNKDRFVEYIAFGGTTPDETKHVGKWCLLIEPIKDGSSGRAAVYGSFPAKINVVDEDHTHAEMSDGLTVLDSTFFGSARILWKESGTGEKWGILCFPASSGVYLWQATADASGGEVTGKMLDEDLSQVGDAETFVTEE